MSNPEMPILRIVPTSSLVLHEDADPRRVERLTRRMREDGIIKNPPIVTPLSDQRYVVLDGANRVSGLWALGAPHAIVQVVNYDQVELDTWYHLITHVDRDALFDAIRRVPGVRLAATPLDAARRALDERTISAYLVCPGGDAYGIANGHSLADEARILVDISNIYRGAANIQRVRIDDMYALTRMYDEVAALLVYPPFTRADILSLAESKAKVPTGITRHVIPGRALRLNLPLSLLEGPGTVEEKNTWLTQWERERLAAKAVRYYAESTYLFDE
ncbi:MAG: hypothetical protein U0822_00430 [Anaerolineae bacterium]